MTPTQRRAPAASGPLEARELVRIAFGPSLLALVVIAAVVLVQLVVANSELTGTLGAVASLWLAVHQVPVSIAGQQLGALPLAPVAAMVWATARSTARITPPGGSWFVIRWIVAAALGGPLLVAAVMLAVVHDAASVITELQTPNALRAFASVATVHGLGGLIGVWPQIRHRVSALLGLPGWVGDAARPALVGAAALCAMSCGFVAASLVVHWGTMHDLYGITDSFFGQLSLTLLSLLYLPNLVLGAAAMAVGSSAHIGFATFSAFTVFGGDIPALPILAAAPTPPLGPVWVALLIVGASAGVAIGQQCARRPLPVMLAFAKLAMAALLAAVILVWLAWTASGPLGNFGHVGVDQTTFGPAVFFWFFVVGGLTVVMAGGIGRGPAVRVRSTPDRERESVSVDPTNPGSGDALDRAMDQDQPEPAVEPESEAQSTSPAPPLTPAPNLDDVEDLMYVDADIENADIQPGLDGAESPSSP